MQVSQPRPSFHRKKDAFQNKLRKEYLHNCFSSIRQQLLQAPPPTPSQELLLQARVQQLVQQLPESCLDLQEVFSESLRSSAKVLVRQMEVFCSKIVGLTAVQWCNVVHILNRLLVNTDNKYEVKRVITLSLLPVLEGAEVLMKKARAGELQTLQEVALQYCYRLGGYVLKLNLLQENALTAVLQALWSNKGWLREQELKLVLCTLNILSSRFEEEEVENVKRSDHVDLEYFKIRLINKLYYSDGNHYELLALIIHRLYCLVDGNQDYEMEELYLRLLICMTVYLDNPAYYYPLLNLHLLEVISLNIYQCPAQKGDCLLYCVGLLNNLMVNDWSLTHQILETFVMSKLTSLYRQSSGRPELQIEIAELFINLLSFMNDDAGFVRGLVKLEVPQLLISIFEVSQEHLCDRLLDQVVCALAIMLEHDPREINCLLAQKQREIDLAIDRYPHLAAPLENLMAKVDHQQRETPV